MIHFKDGQSFLQQILQNFFIPVIKNWKKDEHLLNDKDKSSNFDFDDDLRTLDWRQIIYD